MQAACMPRSSGMSLVRVGRSREASQAGGGWAPPTRNKQPAGKKVSQAVAFVASFQGPFRAISYARLLVGKPAAPLPLEPPKDVGDGALLRPLAWVEGALQGTPR